MRVVEPESIRLFVSHRVSSVAAVFQVPAHIVQRSRPSVRFLRSGSACVLPLRFRGKLQSHSLAERLAFLPGNSNCGKGVALEQVRVASHRLLPFGLSHLVLGDEEGAQSYLMLQFSGISPYLFFGTPHPERATRHPHHHDPRVPMAVFGITLLVLAQRLEQPPEPDVIPEEPSRDR